MNALMIWTESVRGKLDLYQIEFEAAKFKKDEAELLKLMNLAKLADLPPQDELEATAVKLEERYLFLLEQFGPTDDYTILANEKWLVAAERAALRVPAVPTAPAELMPPSTTAPTAHSEETARRVADAIEGTAADPKVVRKAFGLTTADAPAPPSATAPCVPCCTTEQKRWDPFVGVTSAPHPPPPPAKPIAPPPAPPPFVPAAPRPVHHEHSAGEAAGVFTSVRLVSEALLVSEAVGQPVDMLTDDGHPPPEEPMGDDTLLSPPRMPPPGCGGDMAVYQLTLFDHATEFARRGGNPSKEVVEAELFCKADSGTMRKWIEERPLPRGTLADQVDALRAAWLLEMDDAMLLKMNLHGDMQIRHLTPGDYQQLQPIVAGMYICAPYLFKRWSETSNHYKAAAFGFFLVADQLGLKIGSNLRMIPICWNSKLDPDKSYMNERFYNPNEKGHRNFCRILTPDEALCAHSSWSGGWVWNRFTFAFEQKCVPLFAPFLNWLIEDRECVVQGAYGARRRPGSRPPSCRPPKR